jgi:hypothetical protein
MQRLHMLSAQTLNARVASVDDEYLNYYSASVLVDYQPPVSRLLLLGPSGA